MSKLPSPSPLDGDGAFPCVAFMLCTFLRVILKEITMHSCKSILFSAQTVYVQTALCSNCIVWIKKEDILVVRLAWQQTHVYIVYLIMKAYYCIFSNDSFTVLNVLERKRL